jgi:NADH-quinone oxidoreductase subunit C
MPDEIKPESGQGQPPESEKAKAPTPPGTTPDLPEGSAPKPPAAVQPPAHTGDKPPVESPAPATPPVGEKAATPKADAPKAEAPKVDTASAEKPATPAKPAAPASDKPAAPAAAKPAAPAGDKPAAPAPPAKAPVPTPKPWDADIVTRMKSKFGDAIQEAMSYLGDNYFVVDATKIESICFYLRDEEKYNMLADLTAVDYPKKPKRFEIIYQLYSFPHNQRLRVKAAVAEDESPATVVPVWKTANWLEREVYDMFGVKFAGHPDMRRILLPDEWTGFPLRKDHHILQQDDKWVQENLNIESGQ